jgi:ATP-binding cassette subfamily F protein 3
MEILNAQNLFFHNGNRALLDNVSFRVLPDERIGLIGPNGAGKTTLIRLILGTELPEAGKIIPSPGLVIGHVPQELVFPAGITLGGYLLEAVAPLEQNLNSLQEALAAPDAENMETLLAEYQRAHDAFEAAGGYSALESGEKLIRALGMDNPLDQPVDTLSGGEKSLLAFGRAVMAKPGLLILDEPGNHLDFLGLAWLESFLAGWKGAVLTVSHNRYYLDRVCNRIMELQEGKLTPHTGNFSSWRLEKGRRALIDQSLYLANMKEADKLEKKIKELRSIASSMYNPPATVLAQLAAAKRKLGQLLESTPDRPPMDGEAPDIAFDHETNRSSLALRVSGFTFSYPSAEGQKLLFDKASLEIRTGEKVALLGPNGSGKTTLINNIIEHWGKDSRFITVGPSQKIGVLSQIPVFSSEAVTVEDEVRSWGPLSRDTAFHLISPFLFVWADLEKPLAVLSGGEANRLQLARLLYRRADFLILDEPTNHLDIPGQEAIEEALAGFRGTLLLISHDRYFLDKTAERIIEIRDRKLVSHPYGFSEYFARTWPVLPRLSGNLERRGKEKTAAARETKPVAGRLSAEELKRIEQRITETEMERSRLEREIREAFKTNDHIRGRQLSVKLEKCGALLEKLYRDWEASA